VWQEVVVPGRRQIIYLVILATIVVLLNLPLPASQRLKASSRDNLAPFQNVMALLVSRARSWGDFVISAAGEVDKQKSLLSEVSALRQQVWRLKTLEKDNEQLRRLFRFRESHERELILCEVVARGDTSGWWQTVRLNRGSDDGIRPNMAVTTINGLIGKTVEVSRHTCDVLLITDPNCRVACKFSESGAFGIVTGAGVAMTGDAQLEMLYSVRPCRMDYIARDAEYAEGAEVVTSGLGGVYPEGLVLGRVARTYTVPSKLYRRADIVPSADMNALRYVFAVLR
jgi:rod shape-determining protein MreC